MAYQFKNQVVGKATMKETQSATTISLAGINTQDSVSAGTIMNGLTEFMGLVGWTVQDVSRVVTQDIEEVQ